MNAEPSGSPGTLYLVPVPLDLGETQPVALDTVLPLGTLHTAARLRHWVCENARSLRAFLHRVDAVVPLQQPLQSLHVVELPREWHKKGDHAGNIDAQPLLQPAREGHDMGLVSEAGMPAIADPGSSVVRAAHALGVPVVPLVGPVSMMLALAASGLHGQNFAFVGYLPRDAGQRVARIRELEAVAQRTGQTQLCIETPYRNLSTWEALVRTLHSDTRLLVASGLTLPRACVQCHPVQHWRTYPHSLDADTPAVFGWGA
ncbi:SAM-dependent methyltransferase [Candidatus Symbiobacter mobilis]|uniref:Methyltransferase-like protein n=1 Tax=Candidatus Symbiobacter mobilis CR TaxID=946483 RepID=U5N959_9BURK|nr:SAM-dependent methyltransferase [Candidatus Symbiobacter mobilis]AGX86798.1 methyltransferase-like protein [Candidatus Symbiobacter mobilis CR]